MEDGEILSDDEVPPNPNTLRVTADRRQNAGCSDSSDSDSDNEETFEPPACKSARINSSSSKYNHSRSADPHSKVGKLNVWSNVLIEQQMSTMLKATSASENKEEIERGVETYDVSNVLPEDGSLPPAEVVMTESDDVLWDVTDDGESSNNDIRKRISKSGNVKSRLGSFPDQGEEDDEYSGCGGCERKRYLVPVKAVVSAEKDDQTVGQHIAYHLREPKILLIGRVISILGKHKAIDLFNKTQDVESVGGMMTHDGKTRRTPGGVYIQLLKSDPDVTKDQVKEIFAMENEIHKAARKKAEKERRKRKYGSLKQQTELTDMTASMVSGHVKTDSVVSGDNVLNKEVEIEEDFDLMEEPDIEIGIG